MIAGLNWKSSPDDSAETSRAIPPPGAFNFSGNYPTNSHLSVAETNEGVEAYDLNNSFELSLEDHPLPPDSNSSSNSKGWARVGKLPLPTSRYNSDKDTTLAQGEFGASWDEDYRRSRDPDKNNTNAAVKGGVVAVISSPERFRSLVGSVAQNGEVHFEKKQSTDAANRRNDPVLEHALSPIGSLKIGTGETETEITMHQPEMEPPRSPSSIPDIAQDGSFPKFERLTGDDTNLLPPWPESRAESSDREYDRG